MLPTGPLMIEHRLIEKMVARMAIEVARIKETGKIDHDFLDDAIDFMKTYADRCHHGKEEDILFKELRMRKMPADLERTMDQLIEDHRQSRVLIGKINGSNERHRNGDMSKVEIVEALEELTAIYPRHIEEEDRRFFPRAMDLFTREEKDAMIAEFYDFDQKIIHEKYAKVYERWAKR